MLQRWRKVGLLRCRTTFCCFLQSRTQSQVLCWASAKSDGRDEGQRGAAPSENQPSKTIPRIPSVSKSSGERREGLRTERAAGALSELWHRRPTQINHWKRGGQCCALFMFSAPLDVFRHPPPFNFFNFFTAFLPHFHKNTCLFPFLSKFQTFIYEKKQRHRNVLRGLPQMIVQKADGEPLATAWPRLGWGWAGSGNLM